jgi:hypothetical protein
MKISPDIQATLYHGCDVPGSLTSGSYEGVEHHMLHGRENFSFARQIVEAAATQPTAFLLTANSAVPVADSIRGYYDELGVAKPVIDYIYVPTPLRRSGLIRPLIEKIRLQRRLAEAADNVYVVDEFVFTGGTLARACNLLESIGIPKPREMRDKWYGQARRAEVDLDRVTSVHAAKMHEIGRKACHGLLAS